ncbi:50S ribosomal protein L37ae [archaeon]|nr:50S ribosomal protein L37ae [archaeon]
MAKTKKAKSTARYGPRYGKGIKERVKKVEKQKKFKCPQCERTSVKRKSYGVWECSKCGTKFAGGAYIPQTDVGKTAARIINAPEKDKEEETKE